MTDVFDLSNVKAIPNQKIYKFVIDKFLVQKLFAVLKSSGTSKTPFTIARFLIRCFDFQGMVQRYSTCQDPSSRTAVSFTSSLW